MLQKLSINLKFRLVRPTVWCIFYDSRFPSHPLFSKTSVNPKLSPCPPENSIKTAKMLQSMHCNRFLRFIRNLCTIIEKKLAIYLHKIFNFIMHMKHTSLIKTYRIASFFLSVLQPNKQKVADVFTFFHRSNDVRNLPGDVHKHFL